MPYCTEQDLTDRFGAPELLQLSDRDNNGANDPAVIAGAIADADEQINRKLRGRYDTPITPAPAELVPIACDLARYNLYGLRPPEEVKNRYDSAMRELRDYATGINQLEVVAGNADTGQVAVVAPANVFTDATLAKMP